MAEIARIERAEARAVEWHAANAEGGVEEIEVTSEAEFDAVGAPRHLDTSTPRHQTYLYAAVFVSCSLAFAPALLYHPTTQFAKHVTPYKDTPFVCSFWRIFYT
jgi:hypothetical protein